jgi:pterin-4a-carbinolamine dehydratase
LNVFPLVGLVVRRPEVHALVSLSLTTHAVGGLSRNDFVLAAKLQGVIKLPSET